ncbi:AMP-binding protein [Pendulispora brunnea]|uniref:AMP-binding protein n=1 Tax=Pendulispora brunnea TaxID=2905690 RepID=A0ABZ2KRJ2_9BACT
MTNTHIGDLLPWAARQHPHAGIVLVSEEHENDATLITYPQLLEDARRILGGLRAAGHRPGRRVALALERPGDFIPVFWACILGGYIPFPLMPARQNPAQWSATLAYVDALLDTPLLVTADTLQTLRAAPAQDFECTAKLSDPALLMLLPEPADAPKAVVLSHANLLASMASKAERLELTAADVTLNWVPFNHGAALLETHLLPLYLGATQVHSGPAAIFANPLRLLHLVDRHRVSMTFARNTVFAQIVAALGSPEAAPLAVDLSCVRHIVSGGEPVVVETGRAFLERLSACGLARTALRPAFGRPETCAGSIYSSEFPERDANREFASLGLPLPGLEMRVIDGELELRGPMVFSSYCNDADATRAAFTADGWFRTRTSGCIEDGRLRLVDPTKFE